MSVRYIIALAILVSFSFGYGLQEVRLKAADPAACPKYKCKNVYAVWPANAPSVIAYKVINAMTNSNDAEPDIFTTTSTQTMPTAPNGNNDWYQYASCLPSCGKDAAGNWQAKQEITPVGIGARISQNMGRNLCTAAPNGLGDLSDDQSNSNTKTPPGYVTDPGSG